ncbi:MAG: hypothetical protein R2738_03705 [Bacteroides graminisolvens]
MPEKLQEASYKVLSLLLMVAFVLVGAYSVYLIPREEEPQINLPVADIFIGMRVLRPLKWKRKW